MKHLLVAAALVASTLVARAEVFSFYAITSNDSSGYAQFTGESQLYMDVTLLGTGQASLVFTNAGPEDSVVSRINFDFVPELGLNLEAINDGNSVEFRTSPTNPGNLPGGQRLDNAFVSDLSVAAKNPGPKNGLNPYDSVELVIGYDDSFDLFGALENENLRIGLHVQSFTGGYSESFVNVIPEPGAVSMLLGGGFVLYWCKAKSRMW